MMRVRVLASRVGALLMMLTACAPALAVPTVTPGQAGLSLLWVAVAAGLYRVLRRELSNGNGLRELERHLADERAARARVEQALAETQGVLCKLVLEQAGVRDAERNRIARDIHDDLGQNLLALRIELALMQVATSGIHPAVHQKVGAMVSNLDVTIRSLRAVIGNLRPLGLAEGLRGAIERQLGEFTQAHGIAHELELAPGVFDAAEGGRQTDAMLYRVLQEALSNVARHAHASRVRVALLHADGQLTLRVEDDGVGIAAPARPGCWGLEGMRERALAAGGQFAVDGAPGGGTALAFSVPLAAPLNHGVVLG